MLKLKQPTSLQTMASDILVEWIVRCCDHLSVNVSLDKLHHGISVIKENVRKRIPWLLLDSFCNRILYKFYLTARPVSHHKAILEIIMDVEIVGLTIRDAGPILGCLDLEDANRLRRLETLDLTHFPHFEPKAFSNFHLNDLKKLIFANECTDLHLEIIGRNCPKLEVLKIRLATVTDEGLLALSPCSELRVVDVTDCLLVSHKGINNLLSAHKKLEKLIHGSDECARLHDYDVLSDLDLSVRCPSMNYFIIHSQCVTDANIHSILTKFPNLSYIVMINSVTSKFATLKSLDKLSGIELEFVFPEPSYSPVTNMSTWESFKELLTFIGGKIKKLKFFWYAQTFSFGQNDLNFLFDFCPNIEYLEFDYSPDEPRLLIPPFRELKQLIVNDLLNPLRYEEELS